MALHQPDEKLSKKLWNVFLAVGKLGQNLSAHVILLDITKFSLKVVEIFLLLNMRLFFHTLCYLLINIILMFLYLCLKLRNFSCFRSNLHLFFYMNILHFCLAFYKVFCLLLLYLRSLYNKLLICSEYKLKTCFPDFSVLYFDIKMS